MFDFLRADVAGLKNVVTAYRAFQYPGDKTTQEGLDAFAEAYYAIRLGTAVGLSAERSALMLRIARGANQGMKIFTLTGNIPLDDALQCVAEAVKAGKYDAAERRGRCSLLTILCGLLAAEGIDVRILDLKKLKKVKTSQGVGLPDHVFGF